MLRIIIDDPAAHHNGRIDAYSVKVGNFQRYLFFTSYVSCLRWAMLGHFFKVWSSYIIYREAELYLFL